MKIRLISALVLPFLSACTAPSTNANSKVTSDDHEELVYVTGSNMPAKRSSANIKTMSPEEAAGLQKFTPSRAPSN